MSFRIGATVLIDIDGRVLQSYSFKTKRVLGHIKNVLSFLDDYEVDEIHLIIPLKGKDVDTSKVLTKLKDISISTPLSVGGGLNVKNIAEITNDPYFERLIFNSLRNSFDRNDLGAEHFLKELVWREFAYHLLWHFPKLDTQCWRVEWDNFPWKGINENAQAWMQGRTGQSFVDEGMRELYTTGTMHNRLRMIVGSYLTKHLQTDWRIGLKWFEDCLIDWDPASNAMGWQWIAGCGADAAPYFRVFNPILQGEKFDKDGQYTRRYVPELKDLPDKYLHKPWEAPSEVLQQAGLELGKTYPEPIVDLKASREQALAAFKTLKLISEQA